MNHLDEGTIHAWLDGALDAAQSAEVDAHVKACADCSAKVAEARGLIAASSRILTALDDVPANVIPKKALAPAAPRRRLSTASWMSGLAAAAVLVVLWRAGDVERPTSVREITIPQVNVPSLPEPSLEQLTLPAPTPPTAQVAADGRSKVANTPQDRATIGRVSGAAAGAGAASDLASTSASSPALTAATRAAVLSEEAQRREVASAAALRRPRLDSLDQPIRALKDEALEVVGCYRIAELAKVDLKEVVVTGAAESRAPERMARARGAVSSAAPAPAAVQKAAADVAPGVVVRLDSLGLVRAIGSDSIVGAWVHFRADSAQARIGSRSEIVSNLSKVRCP